MRILLFSWLFSISVYSIIFVSIGAHVVYGRCPEDQQSPLLRLKDHLVFDASLSNKLVLWNENVNYCDWNGVRCSSDGCVIGLDLSNESISGGIDNSSSLFSFRFLENLNLGCNKFNSPIPSGFEKLSNLIVLNMSNAGFGGQIPIGISRLSSLVTLDLSSSLILQTSTLKLENPNLSNIVQNLSNLRELLLDGMNLSAVENEWCKALSSSLPNLRVLSLSSCSLSGPIDSSLGKLKFLSVIRLNINNFSSAVPENFADFSNLTVLHLSNSRLNGLFPEKIFQVSTLQSLDLSNNMLLQGSIPDIQFSGSLQILVLSSTNFSGTLPDSIGNFENLIRLDLANCKFGGLIPNSISKLRRLNYMFFSTNRFVGPIPSLSSLKNLTVLNLAHNRLSGSMDSTKWEELSNLVNLDLRNNTLSGTIPFSLFNLPSIQKLQLCFNQFNGSLNGLSDVSSFLLDTLALESNQLGGPIPLSFFEFRGLKILSLSFNNFTGTLDLNSLNQLKNLTKFELSGNSLLVEADGTDMNSTLFPSFPQLSTLNLASCKLRKFPGFLKNQCRLTFLDLSNNELEGVIPPWIWEVTSLSQLNLSCNSLVGMEGSSHNLSSSLKLLDLHSNNFQGPITFFFPPSATYLDFSNNSFNSSIPHDIGKNFSSLVFFSLSRNKILGTIPESICLAESLQVLDFSDNSLSGMFPQCLSETAKNRVVLNLRGNSFNGSIPDTFPITCGLKTLDLSGNNIGGKVPKSLSNCQALEVLDLGNNQINDVFPCPLKNISTLRVLVLRSNNFSGMLGCPQYIGTWASLQIVDLAQNNFSGNLSGEILTKWNAMADNKEYSSSRVNHLRFDFFKFSSVNYQDTVKVTCKGFEMELTKILTVFTAIDLSCNQFHGHIPEEIGELKALYVLNLSHNSFSGKIPSSIGNMIQLGSLDLSTNLFTGRIPLQLATLNFLSVLNLSHNQLVGKIPIGTQIQSFSPDSFEGNPGLCGEPLGNCNFILSPSSDAPEMEMRGSETEFDWKFMFIGVGLGFPTGAFTGTIVGLQVWEKISLTLRGYYYIFMFNNKKQKRKPRDKKAIYARMKR